MMTNIKHRYLKGKHKGVFNRKASKVYDVMILTESIIDAMSLIELGFENVQSLYGTNGFTDEHLKILIDDRVKTVILAFDNDDAGIKAAEKLREKLLQEGFEVKVIFPPTNVGNNGDGIPCKDWNDYLVNSRDKSVIEKLIESVEVHGPEKEKKRDFEVTKEKTEDIFVFADVIYYLYNIKDLAASNFRASVKAVPKQGNEKYYDTVNLFSSRNRSSFSLNMARTLGFEAARIENDLVEILDYLVKERDRHLDGGTGKDAPRPLTEEEIELGMSFLSNTDMYVEVIRDMTILGYVGEETNKVIVWLAAISRLLPKPLSVFIQSPPSTGKSYLLETLLKLLPEESAEWITSVSDQSFNYMDEEDFHDKIFMLGESLHNETVEGYVRQMQSENKLGRKVTVKDPKSGMMKTTTVKHDVRLVFMMTSTAMKVNIENISRCLALKSDISKEQTELIQAMQRHKSSYEGYLEDKYVAPGIIKKHKAAQRLLKKIPVFNPFEKHIRFPSTRAIMRRGQMQFLSLITVSCVARQMQKEPVAMRNPYTGEEEYVYECDLVDYDVARRLFIDGNLLQQDEDLSSSAVSLYEGIRSMVRKKADKERLSGEDVTFIRKDLHEITDLGNESIKRYLRILVETEYLQVIGGKQHGTRFCYKLREDVAMDLVDISSIIPTVDEIKAMMEKEKDKKSKPGKLGN